MCMGCNQIKSEGWKPLRMATRKELKIAKVFCCVWVFFFFFDRILMFTKRSLLLVFPLEIDGTIPPVLGGSLWVRMVDNTLCFCCVFMFQCSVNWKSLTAHFHVDIGREIVQLLECTRVLPMSVTPEGLQNGCLGCGLAFPLPEKSDLIL